MPRGPPPRVGRVAAVVWAIAGAFVLVGSLAEIPVRMGEISRGYGVQDARMILVGVAVGIVAAALAAAASRRAWHGRTSAWLALLPMVLATGAIVWSVIVGDLRQGFAMLPLLASPYGIMFLLPFSLIPGALATLVVWGIDRFASRR